MGLGAALEVGGSIAVALVDEPGVGAGNGILGASGCGGVSGATGAVGLVGGA